MPLAASRPLPGEELLALRRLIAEQASHCQLDLNNRIAIRHFLDSDQPSPAGQELRAMLVLLLRLETSSSEDLGIDGLRRLWHQHSEIISRFGARHAQTASPAPHVSAGERS